MSEDRIQTVINKIDDALSDRPKPYIPCWGWEPDPTGPSVQEFSFIK